MGNKIKVGLSYYPLEVDIFSDTKIKKLIRHKKSEGFTVYIYILCQLYKEGYYLKLDSESAFLFSEELKCEENFVEEIINYCISINLFNKELYDSDKILTSKGIQVRYLDIVTKAKRSTQISEHSLITSEIFRKNKINSETNTINSELNDNNSEFGTGSKVKKRKEKEIPINSEGSDNLPKIEKLELRIYTHEKTTAKNMLWNNRADIYAHKYNSVVVTGGRSRSDYKDFYIETQEMCKDLTNWCIKTGKDVGVWILFAIYCDISEDGFHHIENDIDFENLFRKFERIFFNETTKEIL